MIWLVRGLISLEGKTRCHLDALLRFSIRVGQGGGESCPTQVGPDDPKREQARPEARKVRHLGLLEGRGDLRQKQGSVHVQFLFCLTPSQTSRGARNFYSILNRISTTFQTVAKNGARYRSKTSVAYCSDVVALFCSNLDRRTSG